MFVTYSDDHRPYHVHILKDDREIGRWDIENQRPMDNFVMRKNMMKGLKELGYSF